MRIAKSCVFFSGVFVLASVPVFAVACARRPFLLKYASALRIVVTERRDAVLIAGGTIHSGACVDRISQQRDGDAVTLVVSLIPADGRCSGEYFAMIEKRPNLSIIKLGVPGSNNPQELGVIWREPRRRNRA